ANIVKYYPLPNQLGALNSGVNNYYVAGTAVVNSDTIDFKGDENINDRNRFFLRYSQRTLQQPPVKKFPDAILVAESGNYQPQVSHSAAFNYTFAARPTFLMEFRYGLSRTALDWTTVSDGFNPTTLGF